MRLEDVRTFEALERYLKEFRNFHDEPGQYDFNGAFHLLLAILDNLARNHLHVDMEEHEELRPWFTQEQRAILRKLEQLT
jgi:hypothetical protein